MPRLRLVLAALLASLALAAPAHAQDNSATAVNDQDGSTQIDIAFDFQRVVDGIVDQTNTAQAYASCTECQTIAIAIQIVLVSGDVDIVAPQNIATAVNTECMTCLTVAWAYQFVWGNGERFRITGEARRQIAALAKAFRELEDSGRPANEVLAETNNLLRQLSDVLATGIEPIGPPPREDDAAQREEDDAAQDQAAPDEAETPSGSAEPDATPTPSGTPEPGASATPEPSATAEAEPEPTAAP